MIPECSSDLDDLAASLDFKAAKFGCSTGSAGQRVSETAHAAPCVPLCTAPTGKAEGMTTMDGTDQ